MGRLEIERTYNVDPRTNHLRDFASKAAIVKAVSGE
jgi:hypothetical protein